MFEVLLKPFVKKPAATAEQQRRAAQEVAAKLQTAREELEAARAAHGPLLLKAMAAGDNLEAAKLRDVLAAKETAVRDLEALHETTQAAVRDLEEREAANALQERWAKARALVEQRNAAAERAQAHADALAAEMREILRVEAEIRGAIPVEPSSWPMAWGGALIESLVARHLAGAVPPLFGRHRGLSSVDEVKAKGLAAYAAETGALVLARMPAEKQSQPAAKAASTPEGA